MKAFVKVFCISTLLLIICASMLCSCSEEKELAFRVHDGYIQWQYIGDAEWNNIISVSELNENGELTGKSAYEIACENGFEGTVEEWLESLKGSAGQTEAESQSATEEPSEESPSEPIYLKVTSITSPIQNGKSAKIEIIGQPDTEYTITVYYSSGSSNAKGLEPTKTDSQGYASWSWRIGASTSAGQKKVVISGGGEELITYIEITD